MFTNSVSRICCVLQLPLEINVPSVTHRERSDNFVFFKISSEFSLWERTRVCASEMSMSSSSMDPDDENGILLERKHKETNKWECGSHVQQWPVEEELMESLIKEDEVLWSERSEQFSFKAKRREDGNEASNGAIKLYKIIYFVEREKM